MGSLFQEWKVIGGDNQIMKVSVLVSKSLEKAWRTARAMSDSMERREYNR